MKEIIYLVSPLLVGILSSLFTKNASEVYSDLILPEFAPNGNVFPIVWAILYVLMGLSAYLVYKNGEKTKTKALGFFAISLVANFLWSIIFFSLNNYILAFVWLIILLALIIYVTKLFYQETKFAGLLLVPYVLWVIFAGILNLYIICLN
ncbi:MAG: TspO/MBR family protein [Clostridia bacterium]